MKKIVFLFFIIFIAVSFSGCGADTDNTSVADISDSAVTESNTEPSTSADAVTETFDIETSVVTLKYPLMWKDRVSIEEEDKCLTFYHDKVHLFDLVFKKCDGYLLGKYKDTPIYIINYDVEDLDDVAMQEDVNVIIQHLSEDSDFIINLSD